MATPSADPQPGNGRPHGTTQDQITEMESEGQAQSHASSGEADDMSDQDIDTAGTEADDRSLVNATQRYSIDPGIEVPGDTDSGDIVGPTGEQMPRQSHRGVEDDSR